MQIDATIQSYIQDLKSYEDAKNVTGKSRYDSDFEEIYKQAKAEDTNLETAKIFLNNLDTHQMQTLKEQKHLAEDININTISDEGAYNLLVHTYENLDYNNDGQTDVGEAQILKMLPEDAPHEFRQNIIAAFEKMKENGATEEDMMLAEIGTLADAAFNKDFQENYHKDPKLVALLKEHGVYSVNMAQPNYDGDWIERLKYNFENPKNGEFHSGMLKTVMNDFFKAYDEANSVKPDRQPSLDKLAFEYKVKNTSS